ncbi:MAG TPA: dioxygenase [Stellaceae bacterium]|jgi:rhodanese-related sulfurtransferase|nr:dioxygenase [Stellaceae bacterium]
MPGGQNGGQPGGQNEEQRNKTENDITAEVLARFAETPDPRLRQIMLSLIGHLHAFVKDVELTEAEWFQAIEILTEAGRMCSDKRQEFILFSDTLGVSMVVDLLDHRKPEGATESTVFGPFHRLGAPELPPGGNIAPLDTTGMPALVSGRVLDLDGRWPEVYVLDGGLAGRPLVHGAARPAISTMEQVKTATIAPAELKALLDQGEASIVDFASSIAYEGGHIPGAWFAVRARMPGSLAQVTRRRVLVLTSPDAALARLAAADLIPADLAAHGFAEMRVLEGGTAAWRDAGLPLVKDREAMADTPDDCWRRPYDPYAGEGARERYLRWEIELVHQIEREGDIGFRVPVD